jgi:hypothetical protein
MAARNDALYPVPKLRAHRSRTSDAVQPIDADEQEVVTQELSKQQGLLASYWKYLVAGMCLMFGFYLLMTQLILPFVSNTQQQWNYGSSRITEYDLNVGHGGISHFVAQYYHKQVVIIEMPVDRPEQSKIYAVSETIAEDSSQHIITLSIAYVRRNPIAGKPDLVVSVSGFALPVVLYNTGDSFRVGE